MKHGFATIVLFACSVSAGAQVGVYAMASAGKVSSPSSVQSIPFPVAGVGGSSDWSYGGTFGIYDNFFSLGPLKLGADARGITQSSSGSSTTYGSQIRGGLFGLRLALHAPLLKPYIQAELGGVSTNYTSSNQSSVRTLSGAYQVQIGGDFTVFPHLDVRGEYGIGQLFDYTDVSNSSNKPRLQQIGLGAVLRF